jgi:hypothetical protein
LETELDVINDVGSHIVSSTRKDRVFS